MLIPGRSFVASACVAALLGLGPPAAAQDDRAGSAVGTGPVVSTLEVIGRPEVPIPDVGPGAPIFSPFQIERFACQARKRGSEHMLTASRASAALKATEAAQQVRRDAAAGLRTQREVEDAELARQVAVKAFQKTMIDTRMESGRPGLYDPAYGRDPLDFGKARALAGPANLGAPKMSEAEGLGLLARGITGAPGVVIEGVRGVMVTVKDKPVMVVSGRLRNTAQRRSNMPALLVAVLDQRGAVIDFEFADQQGRGGIPPGQAIEFSYRLTSPPRHAQDVRVSLAPRRMPGESSRRFDHRDVSC